MISLLLLRNLHSLLVERKDKNLGRSWLLGAAAQVLFAIHLETQSLLADEAHL